MSVLFVILMVVAMLLTLGVLFAGLLTMGRSGTEKRERSNQLMRWRILLQGLAIILFALAMLVR